MKLAHGNMYGVDCTYKTEWNDAREGRIKDLFSCFEFADILTDHQQTCPHKIVVRMHAHTCAHTHLEMSVA